MGASDISEFLNQLQERVSLREGIEGHRAILREIYRTGHISLKDLARKAKISLPVVAKVVNFLIEKEVLDRIPEGILYTDKGMQFIERELHFNGIGIARCDLCDGHYIYLSPRWDELVEKLDEILQLRPQVDTQLDQSLADAETNARRALYVYESGALEGKRILCLGDDDFTSVALGLLYLGITPDEPRLIAKELVVTDIDDRILNKITEVLKTEDIPVKTWKWDYRSVIPSPYREYFDTILLDPPYTVSGAVLTLSRAIGLLNPGVGRDIFLSFAHWPPDMWLQLQQQIINMGLAIIQIIPNFNTYLGAEILGNCTQMIHLVTTSGTHPIIPVDQPDSDKIYTGELHPTIRYYYCEKCRKMIEVGANTAISTIEILKTRGCPFCHSKGPFYLDEKVKVERKISDEEQSAEEEQENDSDDS